MLVVSVHAKNKKMKTKIIKLSLSAIFLCLCLTSCKKKVEVDYRPEFIGDWYASISDYNFVHFNISETGWADFDVYWESNHFIHKGKARANNRHLKIGRIWFFDIIEYPHKIDTTKERIPMTDKNGVERLANWKMVLNGIKPDVLLMTYDGKLEYYKADY
jgi:hypothetical protein